MNIRMRLAFATAVVFMIGTGNYAAHAIPPCGGTPTFTEVASVPAPGTYQQGVAIADFNEDGNLDLAFSNGTTSNVSVRFGNGLGGFLGGPDLNNIGIPWRVLAEDFDEDGNVDLAVLSNDSGFVRLHLGNGDGTFNAPSQFNIGALFNFSFDATDVDLDGNLDLVSTNISANLVTITYGDGAGTFSAPQFVGVGSAPQSAAVADFNGDGFMDLASANYSADTLSIRLGSSGGTFSAIADVLVGNQPVMVRAADLDSDGIVDLAVTNDADDSLMVLFGDGAGAFTAGPVLPTSDTPWYAAIQDINNDGKPDIVVVPNNNTSLDVYVGDGTGSFVSIGGPAADNNSTRVAFGDLNNDGYMDLASGNASGFSDRVRIHLGGCSVPPDTTPPTILISSPTATNYFINQVVLANYSCADTESGIVSCVGTSANGAPIDTATTGTKTFTVNAADAAGNMATSTVTYSVQYRVPLTKDDCKNGGWQNLTRADGSAFRNQGDCIQYVNNGH